MKNRSLSPNGRTCLVAFASLLLLAGCAKKSVAPDAEIKPVAYYTEHADEREKAKNACLAFKRGAYTALNAADRELAGKSDFMTNCSNVGEAMLAARAQRQREAAAKYSQ